MRLSRTIHSALLAQRGTSGAPASVAQSVPAYDDFSDLTSETQYVGSAGPFVVGYQYDQAGNRTLLTYPTPVIAVSVSYTYDPLNRVDLVKRAVGTDPAVELINTTAPHGRVTKSHAGHNTASR